MMKLVRKKPVVTAPKPAPAPKVVAPSTQPVVVEFQSDALEIEQRRPPVLARLTLYGVALAIGCGIYWASVSNIDEIVVAPGKLITTQPMLVVQPLEVSVVRSIAVKPGDVVRKGQLLASLDPTFTAADTDQLEASVTAFNAQIARIEAELDGKPYVAGPGASQAEVIQARLAAQRAAWYAARLRDFDAQIAHAQATLSAAANEANVLSERLLGLQEMSDMQSALLKTGTGSRLTFLQASDLSFDTKLALARSEGVRAETLEQLAQTRAERQNFIEEYRRQALESLVELKDKLTSASEELKKANLRRSMSILVAPADAAVLEVAERSIGSVVQPAEPLVTLVPLGVPLEAEVSVAGSDIGHLATHDPARIKFDAFPFQKHGTMEGTVTSISQDAFAPQSAAGAAVKPAYYRVRLSLGDITLRDLPEGFTMLPGMTIAAEINAGERSVISYFLYPLIRGLDEGMREP